MLLDAVVCELTIRGPRSSKVQEIKRNKIKRKSGYSFDQHAVLKSCVESALNYLGIIRLSLHRLFCNLDCNC